MFLANYADGLTDLRLPDQIDHFEENAADASFLSVRPNISYHFVQTDGEGKVAGFHDIAESGIRVNGGLLRLPEEHVRVHPPKGRTWCSSPSNA